MKPVSYEKNPKSPESDYKRDIVNLIGVDYEAVPSDRLKVILHKAADLLPQILNKRSSLTQENIEDILKDGFGIKNKSNEKSEKAARLADNMEDCKAFKANYWKRRTGRIACQYRTSLGALMSKKIVTPTLQPDAHADMLKSIRKCFPFKSMNESRLRLVIEAMSKLSVDAGEFLVKEGDFIEKFYYVQSGLFGTVVSSDRCYVIEYFKPGQCFGSEYLFFGGLSSKSIKCLQSALVWVMESKAFHSFCDWGLKSMYGFLEESLSKTPGLEREDAARLVNALVSVVLTPETNILANTPRSSLYIVLTGEVKVEEVNVRGDIYQRLCGPGNKFGNDRLFTMRFARLLSATTRTNVELFYITEEAFHNILDVPQLYKFSDIEPYQDDLFYRTL